jgi:hypothetical protein
MILDHSSFIVNSGQCSLYLDFWATCGCVLVIGRLTHATQVSCSNVSSHLLLIVPQCRLCLSDEHWTGFDDQLSAWSIHEAFSAIWRLLSGLLQYLEMCTVWIIFAKSGLMVNTVLILLLPSACSLCLFPMSMCWFAPNSCLRSWASKDSVRSFTPRLPKNEHKGRCIVCAMHGMLFLNAGHSSPKGSSNDCSTHVIEWFQEVLSVVIACEQQSVRSKRSFTFFKCTACLATGCWSLPHQHYLEFQTTNDFAIKLIECVSYLIQCTILIDKGSNDCRYGECVH